MVEVRAFTWNPHAGRADELPEVLPRVLEDAGSPELVALQEVWDWGGTIPGYRRVAAPAEQWPHRDARSTILLVKRARGIRVLGETFRQVDGPVWHGPNGVVHPPRLFPRVALSFGDWALEGIGIHRTWVNPNPSPHRAGNLKSWEAEHRELLEWAARRHKRAPGRALVMLGDHNGRRTDAGRHGTQYSLQSLAEHMGGTLELRGIDGAVARDVRVDQLDELDHTYGSDHHPVSMRLRPAI